MKHLPKIGLAAVIVGTAFFVAGAYKIELCVVGIALFILSIILFAFCMIRNCCCIAKEEREHQE